MGLKSPLYAKHVEAGARMVDFGGWEMPLHYGSQLAEHHAVRQHAGAFDVSHMTIVDIEGGGADEFLRKLLANDVAKLKEHGRALYSCMLNAGGGVIDDLIVYFTGPGRYRLIANAATRDKDLAWIGQRAGGYSLEVRERQDLAMIAVQGPEARRLVAEPLAAAGRDAAGRDAAMALQPFSATVSGNLFIARTGYTGEDGFEVMLPAAAAGAFWQSLIDAGVQPCGLGARDTLRLEAGLNLYGADMDESTSPLESGLGWTIAWEPDERDFAGRQAVERVRTDRSRRRFAGLVLEDRGVLRNHQRVEVDGLPDGEITSGGFSPTIGKSIALARLPAGEQTSAKVDLRGRLSDVRIVKPPFVRHGKVCF